LPDEFGRANRLIKEGQLAALRKLYHINKKFINPSFLPNTPDINAFLNQFNFVMNELQELTALIDSYRERGILTVETSLDILIKNRVKRINCIGVRVEKKLERFHKSLPVKARGLRFDRDGSILPE